MSDYEIRSFEIEEMETREDGKPFISGYAAVFNRLSVPLWGFREKIAPGAFKNSLASGKNIFALWNHDSNHPVGSTGGGQLKLEEDEKGLRFELEPIDTTAGRDLSEMIRSGVVKGVSFGFRVIKQEWDEADPKNIIRTLVENDLFEVSPTPFPAYPQTSVSARSAEDVFKSYKAEQELKADENRRKSVEEQGQIDVILAEINALKEI